MAKWQLNFHFRGIIILCPGGSISSFKTFTSRLLEPKAVGMRKKYVAGGSLAAELLPLPHIDSWISDSWTPI